MVQDKLKFFVRGENSPFHLTGDQFWTSLITGCTTTDWLEKRLWKPYQCFELILFIHHQEKYINNFASFYGFQSLLSIELTNLNQSVVVQPVIKQVQIFVPS